MSLMKDRLIIAAGACAMYFFGFSQAYAVDSVSIEWGSGDKTRMLRFGLQSYWERDWLKSRNTYLTGYWDFTLAQWQSRRYRDIPGNREDLFDVGITPTLRFQNIDRSGLYGEAGLGVHLLSELYDNNGRRLSTHLQFGSHLGVGYYISQNIDITVKYQHFSNGSIKRPNSGVDFVIGRIAYRF